MNNKRISALAIINTLLLVQCLHTQHRITFSVKKYPAMQETIDVEAMMKKLRNPQKAMAQVLRAQLDSFTIPGVFASYGGYVTISDIDGKVIFQRKHQQPMVHLVITQHIMPVIMLGRTVHHWEVEPGKPVATYSVERKQDQETKLYYWEIMPTELDKNIIPLDAIIIMAKPKNIYVPTGIVPTNANPQLILPDIYIKKGIDIVANALQILKVKHFFSRVDTRHKKANNVNWSTHVIGD